MMARRWVLLAYLKSFGPVDPLRLDVFSRVFAASLLVYLVDRSLCAGEWLTEAGYHASARSWYDYLPRPFPLLPAWLLPAFLTLLLGSIVVYIIGWQRRWLVWPVLAGITYVTFADQHSAYTLNKLYIVGFAVLALAPAPRTVASGSETRPWQSAWPLRVLQLTVVIIYFTAGSSKMLSGDWVVSGGVLRAGGNLAPLSTWFVGSGDVLWTQAQGVYRTTLSAWMLRELPDWSWAAMQHSALAFELLAPLLLLVRRLRPIGIIWGVGFHLMIALTMYKVAYFNVQMMTFFLLFVDPRTLRTGPLRHVRQLVPLGRP